MRIRLIQIAIVLLSWVVVFLVAWFFIAVIPISVIFGLFFFLALVALVHWCRPSRSNPPR